jgi:hypothetical protein
MRIKSFKFNGEGKVLFWCCFDVRRVIGAMLRTYLNYYRAGILQMHAKI